VSLAERFSDPGAWTVPTSRFERGVFGSAPPDEPFAQSADVEALPEGLAAQVLGGELIVHTGPPREAAILGDRRLRRGRAPPPD
jgi:hypothetical protein